MTANIFRCVQCGRAPLDKLRTAYLCARCAARFPILFNVPLLFRHIDFRPSGYRVLRESAMRICKHLDLEMTDLTHYVLQQIYSYDYGLSDRLLKASENCLIDEFRIKDSAGQGIRIFCPGADASRTDCHSSRDMYCVSDDIHALQVYQFAANGRADNLDFVAADADFIVTSR